VVTALDTWSKVSPVVDRRFSHRGEDVVSKLDEGCARIFYPKTIRVDQGTEAASRALDLRAYHCGVALDVSRPGKPTDKAFVLRRGIQSPGPFADPASCSTARSGRNASMPSGSRALPMPAKGWSLGADTAPKTDPRARSDRIRPSRCKNPPAPPARQRDQARDCQLWQAQGSGHLHSYGRPQTRTAEGAGTAGTMFAKGQTGGVRTFHAGFGDWLAWLSVALVLVILSPHSAVAQPCHKTDQLA
jgi:hypothetical protein